MSEKPYSAVIAAPAADADAVNSILEAMGYGPNTLTLGASSDGVSKSTMLYNHGYVDDDFAARFAVIKAGKIPALDLKDIDVAAVLGRVNISISSESAPLIKTAELCKRVNVKPLDRALPEVTVTVGKVDKISFDSVVDAKIAEIKPVDEKPIDIGPIEEVPIGINPIKGK